MRRDLHLLGYDTAALAVSAADVGGASRATTGLRHRLARRGVGRARTLRDAPPHADGEPLRDGPERVPGDGREQSAQKGSPDLPSAVPWATPTVRGNWNWRSRTPEERRWLADSSGRGAEPGLGGGPGGPAAGMDRRGQGTAWGEDWEEGLARTLPRLPKGAASRVEGRHRRRRLVALGNICVPSAPRSPGEY